jgi:serine/threonine-protein kinase
MRAMTCERRATLRSSLSPTENSRAQAARAARLHAVPALVGGYQLLERIAVGGMAEVFLACKLGERVALKRILPHLRRQPDFVRMFLDEARLAARLVHDNVVRVLDFGRDGGVHYLAMEHVDGLELDAIIRAAAARGRPLPIEDAVTLLIGACEGLHHVHERGIVHRDVTPSNLLVSWGGVVKLADFGIAKPEAHAATRASAVLKGKLAYMSPEQAGAQPLDRRSDVYSLGVCAWELLTLRRRFVSENLMDELRAAEWISPSPSPSPSPSMNRPVPPELEQVLKKALSRAPEDRFVSARAFGDALSAWLQTAGRSPSTARLGAWLRKKLHRRRRAPELPPEPTEPVLG